MLVIPIGKPRADTNSKKSRVVRPSRENPFEEPVFPPVESATLHSAAARGVERKNESVLLGARRQGEGAVTGTAREGREGVARRDRERMREGGRERERDEEEKENERGGRWRVSEKRGGRERTSKRDNAALMRCRLGSVLIPTLRGLASPLLSSPLLASPLLSSPRLASPRLASPRLGGKSLLPRVERDTSTGGLSTRKNRGLPCGQVTRYQGGFARSDS